MLDRAAKPASTNASIGVAPGADARRLDFLDAVRGFAALYISAIHMVSLPPGGLTMPAWLSTFVLFGGTAVTLFFVVSGFSLCLTMPGHMRTGRPLLSFYLKRVLRIAPLFYVWLIASCLRDLFRTGALPPADAILSQVFLIYNLMPGYEEGIVWAGWTIGVEMAFYAVFPLIYWLTPTVWTRLTLYLIVYLAFHSLSLLSASHWLGDAISPSILQFSVLRFAHMFVVGMIVFDIYKHLSGRHGRAEVGYFALLLGMYGLIIVASRGGISGFLDPNQAVAICYGSIILGLALAQPALLVNRVTAAFGRISYSYYLAHPVVIWMLFPVYAMLYAEPSIPLGVKFALAFSATVLCCIPVALITYRLIELPAIRVSAILVKRATARLTGPPVAAPALMASIPRAKSASSTHF